MRFVAAHAEMTLQVAGARGIGGVDARRGDLGRHTAAFLDQREAHRTGGNDPHMEHIRSLGQDYLPAPAQQQHISRLGQLVDDHRDFLPVEPQGRCAGLHPQQAQLVDLGEGDLGRAGLFRRAIDEFAADQPQTQSLCCYPSNVIAAAAHLTGKGDHSHRRLQRALAPVIY